MLIIGDYLVIFLLHKWQATNKGPVAACSAVRLACWRTQSISCRPCTWTEIWNMGTWERNVSVFEKSCPKSSKSLCAPNHFDPWLGPWASPIFRDQLCVLCVKGVLVANWFSEANCVRMFVASADPTFHRQGMTSTSKNWWKCCWKLWFRVHFCVLKWLHFGARFFCQEQTGLPARADPEVSLQGMSRVEQAFRSAVFGHL